MDTSCCFRPVRLARPALSLFGGLALLATAGCQLAATGQNLQGVRAYQQGQYTAALQRFQNAVADDPRNADAYYNTAAVLHRMGMNNNNQAQLAQAETMYNQALDHAPNHIDAHRGLAVLLAQTGRADRAFNLMKNWVVANPQLADARIELARLYHEFGDKETAKLQLDQALQLDHQNARAWTALGHLREQSGDYQQALANYQRSFQINNFQPTLASRITQLQHATTASSAAPLPTSTRTVNVNQLNARY